MNEFFARCRFGTYIPVCCTRVEDFCTGVIPLTLPLRPSLALVVMIFANEKKGNRFHCFRDLQRRAGAGFGGRGGFRFSVRDVCAGRPS